MHYIVRQGRRIEVSTLETKGATKRRPRKESHIGCPVEWLKRVMPVVRSERQLAVALWLYRRHSIHGGGWFFAPNETLRKDLGIDRRVKYRVLIRLERAGILRVIRSGRSSARVKIL